MRARTPAKTSTTPPCRCERLGFPHRQSWQCDAHVDETLDLGTDIQQANAEEPALHRGPGRARHQPGAAMTTVTKNLHQRMDAVRQAVDYIQKQKAVEGYKAVTHDQVTGELREHLVKNGVMTAVRFISGQTVDTGTKTAKGTPMVRFEAVYDIDFINIDDPKDRETYTFPAHAIDHGDKAPGKTASYAVKTAFLKAFNIETGENEESRHGSGELSVDEVVNLKNHMSAAKSLEDLRERTKTALAEASADEKRFKEFQDHGAELAKKFTVKQPTEKKADAPAEAPAEQQADDPPTQQEEEAFEPPSKGLLTSIKNMAKAKDISEKELDEVVAKTTGGKYASVAKLSKVAAGVVLQALTKI